MLEGLQNLLREAGTPLLILAILAVAFVFLRTRGTKLSSVADFDRRIRDGLPTIVEFYSNTWSVCLMSKPIVDGLEKELVGKAKVVRIGVMSGTGMAIARRYGIRGLPTFVVFDKKGKAVVAQAGYPNKGKIIQAVASLGTIVPGKVTGWIRIGSASFHGRGRNGDRSHGFWR